jgi:hypothetical protein
MELELILLLAAPRLEWELYDFHCPWQVPALLGKNATDTQITWASKRDRKIHGARLF